MLVLDERAQVKQVVKSWFSKYDVQMTYCGRSVGKALMELDLDTATAADVAEIIGNDLWVRENACGECQTRSWGIVQIGEAPDHGSDIAYVCGGCLRAALRLLGEA